MKIVLFDFDGTLTKRDSLFAFIEHARGKTTFWIGLFILLPWLVLHKLGILSSQKTKERVLTYFFKGMKITAFDKLCASFAIKIDHLIRPQAIKKIKYYNQQNTRLVIVSASIENWIKPWATQQNLTVIATKLEVIDEKITGRIYGKNCNGIEKVNRIKNDIDLAHFDTIIAYGDTPGDLPMLKLATEKYYKPFRSLT